MNYFITFWSLFLHNSGHTGWHKGFGPAEDNRVEEDEDATGGIEADEDDVNDLGPILWNLFGWELNKFLSSRFG
jgi:hypothetical protein